MNEILNQNTIDELRDIMADDFSVLIESYFIDSPNLVQHIKDSIDNKDLDKLKRVAHTLKGSSQSVGAAAVARLASTLEKASDTFEEMQGLISQLDECYAETSKALRALLVKS